MGHIKVGGIFRHIPSISINVDQTWKNVIEGHVNVGSTWKKVFPSVGEAELPQDFEAEKSVAVSIECNGSYYLVAGEFLVIGEGTFNIAITRPTFTPKYLLIHNSISVGNEGECWTTWSDDGITWTTEEMHTSKWVFLGNSRITNSLAWSGSMWVATTTANRLQYSTNGITWSSYVMLSFEATAVAWNGYYFAVGGVTNIFSKNMSYSYDGITWQEGNDASFPTKLTDIRARPNGDWVATGVMTPYHTQIAYSNALDVWNTWESEYSKFSYIMWDATSSIWIVCNRNDVGLSKTSSNGFSWSDMNNQPFPKMYAFHRSDTQFIAVGEASNHEIVISTRDQYGIWTARKQFGRRSPEMFEGKQRVMSSTSCPGAIPAR